MNDVNRLIGSGILEMYVMGATTTEETAYVSKMAEAYEEVRNEIYEISIAIEQYATANVIEPDPTIGPFLLATIGYMERMKKGEVPAFPPMLHMSSKPEDYAEWTDRDDLQLDEPLEAFYAHIIGHTPEVTTAIAWLKYGAPPEVHTNELEQFLILEGTCDITIGNDVHSLKPGDVLMIPLHISHHVVVTSDTACKVILQRAAA